MNIIVIGIINFWFALGFDILIIIIIVWITSIVIRNSQKSKHLENGPIKQSDKLTDLLIEELKQDNEKLQNQIKTLKTKYDTLLVQNKANKNKSDKVEAELITKKLPSFLNNYSYDPKQIIFLGEPIDYFIFDEETRKIIFIKVKNDQSQLSQKQKYFREAVNNKNIEFKIYSVNDKEISD